MKSEIKKIFQAKRDDLFASYSKQADALRFSKQYSLLIEEFIRAVAGNEQYTGLKRLG